MFRNLAKKVKRKLILWLSNELKPFFVENTLEAEKKYSEAATIGQKTNFSKAARIYNHIKDKGRITIGNNCLIYGDLLIYAHGGNIQMGDFVFLGENSRIWSAVSITIGNHVLISHNVNIHDNNSHPLDAEMRRKQTEIILTTGLPDSNFGTKEERIIIEDDVWIGYNASIGKGVTLGKGSIIAAGSYVFSDVPPYSIVMGNPAKIVSKQNQ